MKKCDSLKFLMLVLNHLIDIILWKRWAIRTVRPSLHFMDSNSKQILAFFNKNSFDSGELIPASVLTIQTIYCSVFPSYCPCVWWCISIWIFHHHQNYDLNTQHISHLFQSLPRVRNNKYFTLFVPTSKPETRKMLQRNSLIDEPKFLWLSKPINDFPEWTGE